jgi:hypothetical protein
MPKTAVSKPAEQLDNASSEPLERTNSHKRNLFAEALASTLSFKAGSTDPKVVLTRYDEHLKITGAALAELIAAQDAECFALEAIRQRRRDRARLMDGADPFPVDPRRMLYVPSRNDSVGASSVKASIAATRFRVYSRPTLTLSPWVKAALGSRGAGRLCSGAVQNFANRFEFAVRLSREQFESNAAALLSDLHAAQLFQSAVIEKIAAERREAPRHDDVEAASAEYQRPSPDQYSLTELQLAIGRVLDVVAPGFPYTVYRRLLPEKLRESEALSQAAVPPAITIEQLFLSEEHCTPMVGLEAVPIERVVAFVRKYRVVYHPIVERMLAIASGAAAHDRNRKETAIGVPIALATFSVAQHYPPWQPVVGTVEQPVDLDAPPLLPPEVQGVVHRSNTGKGSIAAAAGQSMVIPELSSASALAQGVSASYYECFALLLVHCEAFTIDALRVTAAPALLRV